MPTFYIVEEGETPYEVNGADKDHAVVNWARKRDLELKDVFYGVDDGQISVLSEKEWKEYQKEHPPETKTFLCEITIEKETDDDYLEELEECDDIIKVKIIKEV